MNCLRCEIPMSYRGTRSFHEGTQWGLLGDLGELFVNKESFDVYACSQCGKVEFFVSGSREKHQILEHESLGIEISGVSVIPRQADLLKLTQGSKGLDDVYKTIGPPINFHTLKSGIVLCYRSEDKNNPHVILIDHQDRLVQLVAVFNDSDKFTLEKLEHSYGQPELVGAIDGHEHWLFEGAGVAFITESRNEDYIWYVQFFNQYNITFDVYLELNGFSEETFVCAAL